ncbi:MAG: FHA domain-containing protein [Chloroflexi bacterium]|nr:FHA domain-containing protein [Chloroflexota bacterium]
MKSASKWMVAGGALLLIVGFLLPVISISGQNAGHSINISLLKVAGHSYWFFLYLVPLGALAMIVLSFIPADNQKTKTAFLIGQVGGWAIDLLLLLGALIYFLVMPEKLKLLIGDASSLDPQSNIWPGIGLFVLLFGIGSAIVGVLAYFFPEQKKTDQVVPPEPVQSSVEEEAKPIVKEAYLEATKGQLLGKKICLDVDDFSVGRNRDNNLQLSDTRVSRLHARLRYAQGSWFIQDQNSTIGTFVNGKQIKAIRLNSGDHIRVGENTFIFHL